jgi:hypothetical protein
MAPLVTLVTLDFFARDRLVTPVDAVIAALGPSQMDLYTYIEILARVSLCPRWTYCDK